MIYLRDGEKKYIDWLRDGRDQIVWEDEDFLGEGDEVFFFSEDDYLMLQSFSVPENEWCLTYCGKTPIWEPTFKYFESREDATIYAQIIHRVWKFKQLTKKRLRKEKWGIIPPNISAIGVRAYPF